METGIQVSSLKPLLLTPEQTAEAFTKISRLGCTTVQLQWIDRSVPIEHIAQALKDNGLTSVSVQDFYQSVQADPNYYVNLNKAAGGKWLCVSRIPQLYHSREGLDRFLPELRALQARLTPLGQTLCLHPVSSDFTAVASMDAVAYLLEQMPELDLCLDLYHLNRSCRDMPGFIRRWAGRICMVHFKDSLRDTLVPVGQGDTCWDGVVRACLDAKIPYGFVEQERWETDPYLCLKEGLVWLETEILAAGDSSFAPF